MLPQKKKIVLGHFFVFLQLLSRCLSWKYLQSHFFFLKGYLRTWMVCTFFYMQRTKQKYFISREKQFRIKRRKFGSQLSLVIKKKKKKKKKKFSNSLTGQAKKKNKNKLSPPTYRYCIKHMHHYAGWKKNALSKRNGGGGDKDKNNIK